MGLWSVVGAGEDHVDFVPKGGWGAAGAGTKLVGFKPRIWGVVGPRRRAEAKRRETGWNGVSAARVRA